MPWKFVAPLPFITVSAPFVSPYEFPWTFASRFVNILAPRKFLLVAKQRFIFLDATTEGLDLRQVVVISRVLKERECCYPSTYADFVGNSC